MRDSARIPNDDGREWKPGRMQASSGAGVVLHNLVVELA